MALGIGLRACCYEPNVTQHIIYLRPKIPAHKIIQSNLASCRQNAPEYNASIDLVFVTSANYCIRISLSVIK